MPVCNDCNAERTQEIRDTAGLTVVGLLDTKYVDGRRDRESFASDVAPTKAKGARERLCM